MISQFQEELMSRVAAKLDIPGNLIAGEPKIQILGSRELSIENHRGIQEYGDSGIRVSCGRGNVYIRGKSLTLKLLNGSELLIAGKIEGIEFE